MTDKPMPMTVADVRRMLRGEGGTPPSVPVAQLEAEETVEPEPTPVASPAVPRRGRPPKTPSGEK